MAVEFWTRRQPVTFYPSKGKGRNNPFSFENFKTFVGYLTHTVAFAFGTRATFLHGYPMIRAGMRKFYSNQCPRSVGFFREGVE